ncbi:MAG: hypothetical protein Q4C53_09555 [Clostridia bacterium]|nr:hypothetical protein [Clostridia bacterium]
MENGSAALRDELTGALIGLARATEGNTEPGNGVYRVIVEGLIASDPASDRDDAEIGILTGRVREEKHKLAPGCRYCASPCGRTAEYDLRELQNESEEIRALKERLLGEIRRLAASHETCTADGIPGKFLCEALFRIGYEDTAENLQKTSETARELLNRPMPDGTEGAL